MNMVILSFIKAYKVTHSGAINRPIFVHGLFGDGTKLETRSNFTVFFIVRP